MSPAACPAHASTVGGTACWAEVRVGCSQGRRARAPAEAAQLTQRRQQRLLHVWARFQQRVLEAWRRTRRAARAARRTQQQPVCAARSPPLWPCTLCRPRVRYKASIQAERTRQTAPAHTLLPSCQPLEGPAAEVGGRALLRVCRCPAARQAAAPTHGSGRRGACRGGGGCGGAAQGRKEEGRA